MKEFPKGAPLFRPEVIANRADTLFGNILVPQLPVVAWMFAGVVVLTAALLTFLVTGEYTRRVPAVGWLTTFPGPARIASPKTGTVVQVATSEGALVKKGDILISIATGRATDGVRDVEEQVITQLEDERDRLTRQLQVEKQLSEANEKRVRSELQEAKYADLKLRELVILAQQRLKLAELDSKRAAMLAEQGHLPKSAAEKAEDAALAARTSVEELSQRRREKKQVTTSLQDDLQNAPLTLEKRAMELEGALAQINQRITQAQGAHEAIVVAPTDGRVSGLSLNVGQSLAEGSLLLTIVPERADLRAELLVPARVAGFVHPGMEVKLSYDAFPYHQFGRYEAHIATVGGAVLSPQEQVGPLRLQEPAFVATLQLAQDTVSEGEHRFRLKPGITLKAEIAHEKRRIIEWLFDPLYAASGSM